MKLDKKEVKKLADLAKLELSDKELGTYQKQLGDILSYADKINKLEIDDIRESLTGVRESDVVPPRPDVVQKSDPQAIEQASLNKDNYVKAANVFEK
ncbi:Asp-tRNA(Asn)/Glu-tRNA(Gln) amidotransferase subunit GatC [Candidatus Parcubacteria bacterium]|jgi:aspartyl-tRNA(Asn)/glutamyl-tRNA(Gln) amidotransferase subunit C|nr:Asp-tRNA(Asn)/Glu-tRNA(Gln) amidotransferase subunit GatC [Candidatus Parcubacteria bacterium]